MRFLIVGQGVAGTTLGFRLLRAGHTVHFTDAPGQTAASTVAAGIVNPITGRRFVKSWRIDELLPATRALYTELETFLGGRYYYELPLIRTLYNRGDVNDWQARSPTPATPPTWTTRPTPAACPNSPPRSSPTPACATPPGWTCAASRLTSAPTC